MSEHFESDDGVLGVGQPVATSSRAFVDEAVGVEAASTFLPLLILGLSMLAWFAFQAVQLHTERDAIRETGVAQAKHVEEAKKLLDSLDAIARGTNQLAESGNPNARLIVDELRKRGITYSNQAAAAAPAPADK